MHFKEVFGKKVAMPSSTADKAQDGALSIELADVAMLVHELRTPLIALLGFARQMAHMESMAERGLCNARIERVGQHALDLVNDLLTLAKIDSGQTEVRRVCVETSRLLSDCLDVVSGQKGKDPVKMQLVMDANLPPLFMGDPQRLRQILINVLANAVKFSDKGMVTLRAWSDTTLGTLCFTVEDCGIGIPPDQLATLFQPFVQLGHHGRGGTGLGLVVSRNLAHAMGGDLTATSTLGVGSVFTLQLPYIAAPSAPVHVPDLPLQPCCFYAAPTTYQRCLVIDDNDMLREIYGALLRRAGHDVLVAGSGREALALLDSNCFDLILLDHQMAGMDGFSTARRIRAHPRVQPTLRIIGISAVVTPQEEAQAVDAGMDACLVKTSGPQAIEDIFNRLNDLRHADSGASR